ncbi:unnamed protein product [Blepharisma stoltei]|uniref:DNA damage-binding protein 1 n=1 Tax=Blepharisma stoltei TaxID=1481888 RepID=A0AAU9KC56_9CILI|nr:unnamed protein product [Blepharisma stoltei]
MESFSFYQEAIPCSGISNALIGNFSSENSELLVAKNNLLELYTYACPLRLICKFPLQGEVDSLTKLAHSSFKTDLVIIVCKEAQITTLIYNEKVNSFEIVALHSFENEKGIKEVRIMQDPDSRCVAGKLLSNRMFVIPVKNIKTVVKEEQYTHSLLGNEYYKPVFIIDIPIFAKSMAMLKGFVDPVLAVLHSPKPIELAMHVKFLSINLKKKEVTLQKEVGGLPGDCFTLIPLHAPLKGVLVLGHRSIHYIGESAQRESNMNYYLYNSTYEFINPHKLLLLLCTGELILLSLNYMERDDGYILDDKSEIIESIISLELQCQYNAYDSQLLFANEFLFIASKIHDSFLFKLSNQQIKDVDMDEDEEIRKKKHAIAQLNYSIEKCDELVGLSGAICSLAVKRNRSDGETVKELFVCHGYGKNSYISKVSLTLQPFKYETFDEETFPDIQKIVRLSSISAPRSNRDLYIIINKQEKESNITESTILQIDESIEEVSDNKDFFTDRETVGAGRINEEIIYQCHAGGLRLLNNEGLIIRDIQKAGVWQVTSVDEYLTFLFDDGTVESFKIYRDREEKLPSIEGQGFSISMCDLNNEKIIAIAKSDGGLQLFNVITGKLLLWANHACEGPAIINSEETSDIPISDLSRKVQNFAQFENAYISEIHIRAFGNILVLCGMVNTGEILIYKSFGNFNFSRVTSSLFLGPAEWDHDRHFFSLPQGIFVACSSNNFLVTVNQERDRVHIHPSLFNGQIKAMCSFNHADCPNGFIYRENDILVIGRFEDSISAALNQEVLMIRKNCSETPRHIIEYGNYIIVSFFTDKGEILYNLRVFMQNEETGLTEVSSVQQFSANEIILSMCIVKFSRKLNPPFEYLAIGTGMAATEDTTTQGRLILFALDQNKLVYQPLHKKPGLKGAISSLGNIDGYLLVGVGSEIKIFIFVDEEGKEWLEPISFYYGYTMATGMDIENNMILCTDTMNQMYILSYEEANSQKNLQLKGQYFRELFPLAASFNANRQVIADGFRNIHIFLCRSDSDKIEKVGDLHTGLTVYTFAKCDEALLMMSQEGAISVLTATNEMLYKKMHTLQNALLDVLPYNAGLNPRGYRLCSTQERERQRKSVLDLTLVFSFCYLSAPLQRMIARNIGTTPHNILKEMQELKTHHFI